MLQDVGCASNALRSMQGFTLYDKKMVRCLCSEQLTVVTLFYLTSTPSPCSYYLHPYIPRATALHELLPYFMYLQLVYPVCQRQVLRHHEGRGQPLQALGPKAEGKAPG
jgi:hypothetical protein